MGKKSRVKAARQVEKELLDAKRAEQKKEQQKTTKTVIISVCACLLAIAVFFGATAAVTGSGVLLRGAVSLSTEHTEVDNAMLSYFFYNEFYNFLNQNATVAQQKGLSSTLSLKQQNYTEDITWFDYIMGRAVNNLSQYLMLAEAAKADGLALDDSDYKIIDENITSLEANAKEAGVSKAKYISANYGRGVKEDDIRRALELVQLADKKNTAIIDSISFTDDEMAKHFDENKDLFTYVSYKAFDMDPEEYYGTNEFTEDERLAVSTMATMLGASRSAEEFDTRVKEYLTGMYKNIDKELTAEELEARIAATNVTDDSNYSDAFAKWAWDDARKAGDTTVISEGDKHTAYLLTEPAHKLDYTTKNVKQMLFNTGNYENADAAKAEAEKVLAEWKAGASTAESFDALAKEKNEGAAMGLASSYDNLMKNIGLDEFEDWLYDEARKPGDVDIVKTYYGYHIMYFVGDGIPAWEVEVEAAMTDEKYQEIMEELEKTYTVTYNESKYDGVSGKFPKL